MDAGVNCLFAACWDHASALENQLRELCVCVCVCYNRSWRIWERMGERYIPVIYNAKDIYPVYVSKDNSLVAV